MLSVLTHLHRIRISMIKKKSARSLAAGYSVVVLLSIFTEERYNLAAGKKKWLSLNLLSFFDLLKFVFSLREQRHDEMLVGVHYLGLTSLIRGASCFGLLLVLCKCIGVATRACRCGFSKRIALVTPTFLDLKWERIITFEKKS